MKTKLLLIIPLFLFAGLIILPSCNTPEPATGNLFITVYNPGTGSLVVNEQVYLATSYYNLTHGIYLRTAWTNIAGQVYFGDLDPGYYYYDTEHWEDYGGTLLYAGFDFYVHLYVNTPGVSQK